MQDSEQLWKFIEQHQDEDISKILLSNKALDNDKIKFVAKQIEGRKYTQSKIPSWAAIDRLIYPKHLSLEQCSSELTAKYKASIVKGDSFVDLTGGFGVDTFFLSKSFKKGIYVEQQLELKNIVTHNFKLLGVDNITTINSNATDYIHRIPVVNLIFIDPARRALDGSKVVSIADCEPNIIELLPTFKQKSKQILVKLSPMLDISMAYKELEYIKELHIVSVKNECKELLFLLDFENITEEKLIICTNIHTNRPKEVFVYDNNAPTTPTYCLDLQNYLYEPNSSIMKSGAFDQLSSYFKIDKLHKNSHLYTSDKIIKNIPGRVFKVIEVFTFDKKSIKKLKSSTKKANIAIRNFPSSVDTLRKKLKIAEGGDNYLFATTLLNDKKVLILCKKNRH